MLLSIADTYRARDQKVHNIGDNGLAKRVPKKGAGRGLETNVQQTAYELVSTVEQDNNPKCAECTCKPVYAAAMEGRV